MNAPRLIFYTPEHLEDTIEQGSKNLGITRKEYIKKGLVCTNLFVCKIQNTTKPQRNPHQKIQIKKHKYWIIIISCEGILLISKNLAMPQ